ncbi:conserved protein, unknown function [Hepatocystis sp. ex Piliocolobus tephrosceles]|nr:conserved protein, unknown function [Hepatocystis sp. ex Piliocolobus tephrosceles]
MEKFKSPLMNKNISDVFISYNDMIQDNEYESSYGSYKDVSDFLENSESSSSQYSSESEPLKLYNSHFTNRKANIQETNSVNDIFTCEKENILRHSYTDSYINEMDSMECFPFTDYKHNTTNMNNISELAEYQWKPYGRSVPDISSINLTHRKAWDIGREGCNGILIKSILDSYNKKKLNYILLDGTNIDTFLIVFSHTYQEIVKGVDRRVIKTFSFYDILDANFMFDTKTIHITKKKKQKKKEKVIIKGLSDNFFNAILVCMNEIIRYLRISNLKGTLIQKLNKKKKQNEKKKANIIEKQNDTNERTYFVKSIRNEKNVYNNNIKDILLFQKKKKKKKKSSCISKEETNKENDTMGAYSVNSKEKKNKNRFTALLSSSNTEEFGYTYIKDIIQKEKKDLYETDKMYINSNNEYSSHTSDSAPQ